MFGPWVPAVTFLSPSKSKSQSDILLHSDRCHQFYISIAFYYEPIPLEILAHWMACYYFFRLVQFQTAAKEIDAIFRGETMIDVLKCDQMSQIPLRTGRTLDLLTKNDYYEAPKT